MNVEYVVYFFRVWLPPLVQPVTVEPMSELPEVTRTECRCDARLAALHNGDFIYWPHSRAWVFTDGPFRAMSPAARYYAFVDRAEFKHEDHAGELYTWVDCPFCGHALPNTHAPRIVWPRPDGGEGAE